MDDIEVLCSDGDGAYCCPLCYTWFVTPEEKVSHLEGAHGYETLNLTANLRTGE